VPQEDGTEEGLRDGMKTPVENADADMGGSENFLLVHWRKCGNFEGAKR